MEPTCQERDRDVEASLRRLENFAAERPTSKRVVQAVEALRSVWRAAETEAQKDIAEFAILGACQSWRVPRLDNPKRGLAGAAAELDYRPPVGEAACDVKRPN